METPRSKSPASGTQARSTNHLREHASAPLRHCRPQSPRCQLPFRPGASPGRSPSAAARCGRSLQPPSLDGACLYCAPTSDWPNILPAFPFGNRPAIVHDPNSANNRNILFTPAAPPSGIGSVPDRAGGPPNSFAGGQPPILATYRRLPAYFGRQRLYSTIATLLLSPVLPLLANGAHDERKYLGGPLRSRLLFLSFFDSIVDSPSG